MTGNQPPPLTPPTPPSAPCGAALTLPTSEPLDPRQVRVALAYAYPVRLAPRLGREEAYQLSNRASGGYAPWHYGDPAAIVVARGIAPSWWAAGAGRAAA